jgi:hypothetical protein
MNTPKVEHKIRKTESAHRSTPHHDAGSAAPESTAAASITMIEACDRLSGKLDELTTLIREQVQAGQQMQSAESTGSIESETAAGLPIRIDMVSQNQIKPRPQADLHPTDSGEPVRDAGSTSLDTTDRINRGGTTGMAENTRRLIDTLSQSRDGWQEQAADLHRALEAVMDFLETQAAAATAAPKIDVAEIMNRLRNLEEEQRNLRSQISLTRWSPA